MSFNVINSNKSLNFIETQIEYAFDTYATQDIIGRVSGAIRVVYGAVLVGLAPLAFLLGLIAAVGAQIGGNREDMELAIRFVFLPPRGLANILKGFYDMFADRHGAPPLHMFGPQHTFGPAAD